MILDYCILDEKYKNTDTPFDNYLFLREDEVEQINKLCKVYNVHFDCCDFLIPEERKNRITPHEIIRYLSREMDLTLAPTIPIDHTANYMKAINTRKKTLFSRNVILFRDGEDYVFLSDCDRATVENAVNNIDPNINIARDLLPCRCESKLIDILAHAGITFNLIS